MNFSEKILHSAEEGIVLLKNENSVLPFTKDDSVSVFGRIQFDFYRCGTGSGGSVHVPYITNLTDSLIEISKSADSFKIDEGLADIYRDFIKNNPFDNGGGLWAAEPWCQKDMEISLELAQKSAEKSNKAVYVVGRNCGEDKDYVAEKGSWYLTDIEKNNIEILCDVFKTVIIVFNTSGIVDTAWIQNEKIKDKIGAVLYAWQGGQESGRAAANILAGVAVPCGKLTDTVAKTITSYPSTKNFAEEHAFYKEDIFVGYRYFNTFAKCKILYPFGFGLGYTTFEVSDLEARSEGTKVTVKGTVKNSGEKYSGKEVLQVYVSAPQGNLGKSSVELTGFAKTRLLNPGESETLEISFNIEDFASYDDSGESGFEFCRVLEKGDYYVLAGTDSLSAKRIPVDGKAAVSIPETYVIEKLEQCCAPLVEFERLTAGLNYSDGTCSEGYKKVPVYKVNLEERIRENLPKEIPFTGDKGITFDDVKKDRSKLDEFVGQLDSKLLAAMVRGEGMLSQKVTPGIASAFGGLSESLYKFKIPCAGCADGPSGLRLDNGKESFLMPVGTQLACTWNLDLVKDLYEEEGKELAAHQIDALLGPGINIHRNPLNGRNFEYFSEDPFLAGKMAVAQIQGIYDGGSNATIKHFALNSQETMRRTMEAVVSERAMREIYLKPFEMAVKAGVVKSIMTSYNAINGHWAASNYDLVNTILHKEWGYTGMVMTDWWAYMNDCVKGGEPSVKDTASMVRARNDIYMVVDNDTAEKNLYGDNIQASLDNGSLTLGELQLCVKDILGFILDAPVSKRPLRDLNAVETIEPLSEAAALELEKISAGSTPGAVIKGETLERFMEGSFVPDEGKSYVLNINREGIYRVTGVYMKVGDTLSQSATNIYLNDIHAASFDCRTTLGKGVYVIANQVILKPGKYKLTIAHTKPGIEILDLYFATKTLQ